MTLPEMLGMIGALLALVAGVIIGFVLHLGWWICATGLAGLVIGWVCGAIIAPFVDVHLKRTWDCEQSRKKDQADRNREPHR